MKHKHVLVAVSILVLAAFSLAVRAGLAQNTQPIDQTIPYPGYLRTDAGQPVPDGAYDFTFALYNAREGGEPMWSETQSGISVQGGAFVATLGSVTPLPEDIQASGGHWLAVSVRGPGEASFTTLDQRQTLVMGQPASVNTAGTCAHTHFGEAWTGTGIGLNLTSDGVGGETLFVSTSGDHDGVRAYSQGASSSSAALKGSNLSSGTGVYGSSSTGTAIVANSPNTALEIRGGGAIKVTGAGVGSNTAVFIHQARTGAGGNICSAVSNATVIDNPMTNGDPNAVLFITVNGGTMGSVKAPSEPEMAVSYDTNNMCGFGRRWLIINLSYSAIPDGAKFNVMVVKP